MLPYIPKALVNIQTQDLAKFKHEYNVNAFIKHETQSAVTSTRYFELTDWLDSTVGKGNYLLGFWDGGQYGYWALAVNDPEDFIAFKLAFAPL